MSLKTAQAGCTSSDQRLTRLQRDRAVCWPDFPEDKGGDEGDSLNDGFSAHSLRVGMAQDLSAAGAELTELMTAGRWESPTMPTRYIQAQAADRGAARRGILRTG